MYKLLIEVAHGYVACIFTLPVVFLGIVYCVIVFSCEMHGIVGVSESEFRHIHGVLQGYKLKAMIYATTQAVLRS